MLLIPSTYRHAVGGYSAHTVSNNGGSWVGIAAGAGADLAAGSLIIKLLLNSIIGTRTLVKTSGRTYINLVGADVRRVQYHGGTLVGDATATGVLAASTLLTLQYDFDAPNGIGRFLVNAVDTGMAAPTATPAGTLQFSRASGFLATDTGTAQVGCQVIDLALFGSIKDASTVHNGGVPFDLGTLGAPLARLGGAQLAANWNAPNSLGTWAMTSSGGFTDV